MPGGHHLIAALRVSTVIIPVIRGSICRTSSLRRHRQMRQRMATRRRVHFTSGTLPKLSLPSGWRTRFARLPLTRARPSRLDARDPTCTAARHDRRRVAAPSIDLLGREPNRPRAGHVHRDVVGALLVQVIAVATWGVSPPRRRGCSSAPARAPASSTSATAARWPLRIESHNHPSAVEPHQGAATGVGGIIRDIFSMGARPIALMDPLRFGPLDVPRNRYLRRGCGRRDLQLRQFRRRARRWAARSCSTRATRPIPLVNVFCLGVLPKRPPRAGPGRGSKGTWRCSSARRPAATASAAPASSPRPDSTTPAAPSARSVQVGDPFEEKKLIEACLDLLDSRPRRRGAGPRRRRICRARRRRRRPRAAPGWTSTSPGSPGGSPAWTPSR